MQSFASPNVLVCRPSLAERDWGAARQIHLGSVRDDDDGGLSLKIKIHARLDLHRTSMSKGTNDVQKKICASLQLAFCLHSLLSTRQRHFEWFFKQTFMNIFRGNDFEQRQDADGAIVGSWWFTGSIKLFGCRDRISIKNHDTNTCREVSEPSEADLDSELLDENVFENGFLYLPQAPSANILGGSAILYDEEFGDDVDDADQYRMCVIINADKRFAKVWLTIPVERGEPVGYTDNYEKQQDSLTLSIAWHDNVVFDSVSVTTSSPPGVARSLRGPQKLSGWLRDYWGLFYTIHFDHVDTQLQKLVEQIKKQSEGLEAKFNFSAERTHRTHGA